MAGPQYFGTIPNIQQAFQNDPRTKLAQSAMALGTSTAPVAQGGWAIPDGLARAAQAIAGAVINKNQEKKYGTREQAYTQGMADAARMASTPQPMNPAAAVNPATANPGMAAAAGALSGGAPAPIQTIDPNTALGGQGAPQGANMAPSGVSLPLGAAMPSGGAPSPLAGPIPFTGGGTGPKRGAQPVSFINPLGGTGRATSSFGTRGAEFHNGQDWAAPAGTPIMAAGDGVVIAAGTNNRSGNFVRIRHADGTITGYAHLKEAPGVERGAPVTAGSIIGTVGSTGRSTGNHLHFTVTDPRGRKVNPASIEYGEAPVAQPQGPQQGAQQVADAVIPMPQMEARPQLPEAPGMAPGAPQRPQEVVSNRVGIAQSLMQSGNPDLMAIAQQYLDKGLDEQGENRRMASQQEFQQGQTGYSANLADWQNARGDARNAQYTEYRDVGQRNFTREQTNVQQQFQAGQAGLDRSLSRETREDNQAYGSAERQATQTFQAEQARIANGWQSNENKLNRDTQLEIAGIRADASGRKQQQRNAYFSTPTGLKMQKEAGDAINMNNDAIGKYQRFMDLNEKQGTGGVALNTPGISSMYGWADSDLREMNALANDATLASLGGGLGAQISDSDRKFIMDSNISTSSPRTANENIARARIGALRRKNDYLVEFANAQADGTAAQFSKEWGAFAQATPIVQYDRNGKAKAVDKPITFSQWRASRPRYDAQGRKVN